MAPRLRTASLGSLLLIRFLIFLSFSLNLLLHQGYTFDFIEGEMHEKSPFTFQVTKIYKISNDAVYLYMHGDVNKVGKLKQNDGELNISEGLFQAAKAVDARHLHGLQVVLF